jgi:serine-type D-Ala-D-Ala carboxypeptidase/endopeptidase (penicillin-binding protein 4)
MARQPEFGDWKRTLAVAGSPDGSLRHRLRQADTVDRVWAKTGSLNHVSSLAGYVQAESGQTYAFAIILNGRRVHDGSAHAFEDRIVRVIVRKG